jgi:hypothetical protein
MFTDIMNRIAEVEILDVEHKPHLWNWGAGQPRIFLINRREEGKKARGTDD